MKMTKKLQVAAAAASLFAMAGVATAASVSQSGVTVAMEVIKPGDNATRVRAPTVTYSYQNGPNAQANGSQRFEVTLALGGAGGKWALRDAAGLETGFNFSGDPALAVQTISARLRVSGSRVPVLNVNPGAGLLAIKLLQIDNGDTLINSPTADSNNTKIITYRFELVNNTTQPLALSDLDLTFNTSKTLSAAGVGYLALSDFAAEGATTGAGEYAVINGLGSLVTATTGHNAGTVVNGVAGCATNSEPRLTLRGNSGINGVQGTEPNTPNAGDGSPAFNPGYVVFRRALDLVVARDGAVDRLVATTNSFPTNYTQVPVNGEGGTGGGRLTFRPTTAATVTNNYPNAPTVGATSGDERVMKLGSVTFLSRNNATLDRSLAVDQYDFAAQGARATGDFTTAGVSNTIGGVDINGLPPGALELSIVTPTRPFSVGSTLSVIAGASAGAADNAVTCLPFAANTLPGAAVPAAVQQADGTFLSVVRLSHADLLAAVGGTVQTATLRGRELTVCYNVTGNADVPAPATMTVTARLLKDDATEQVNESCPSTFAVPNGGVKVDIRNFLGYQPGNTDPEWQTILRIINNSETDTATVEGQYIMASGAYGKYGQIGVWAPRAARYVTSTQIANALSNVPTGGTPDASTPTITSVNPRIRISADVSTLRVQTYIYNRDTRSLVEVSGAQGADFVNVESSNRDHIDQDAQTGIKRQLP